MYKLASSAKVQDYVLSVRRILVSVGALKRGSTRIHMHNRGFRDVSSRVRGRLEKSLIRVLRACDGDFFGEQPQKVVDCKVAGHPKL